MINENNNELEKTLWAAADKLRSNMDAAEYKHIVLGLIFRKYKALFPEKYAKKHQKTYNAIDAIYNYFHQKVQSADVTEIIMQLQSVIDDSVDIQGVVEPSKEAYIDLSKLDFNKLRAAFAKHPRKNSLVFDLQKAIDKKLKRMLAENPLRYEFYEKYKEIIREYNEGKDIVATQKTFDKLTDFVKKLGKEEKHTIREDLDKETLAIFDLLIDKKGNLNKKEREEVKKVAQMTLEKLKTEKLKAEKWRESTQIKAQVKTLIFDSLLNLPAEIYPEKDVEERTNVVYQHIFTNYYGGGKSVYNVA